jgi:hypothetical protein
VTSHVRDDTRGRATTLPEHMPPKHRHQAEWTPERFLSWGEQVGPETAKLLVSVVNLICRSAYDLMCRSSRETA